MCDCCAGMLRELTYAQTVTAISSATATPHRTYRAGPSTASETPHRNVPTAKPAAYLPHSSRAPSTVRAAQAYSAVRVTRRPR